MCQILPHVLPGYLTEAALYDTVNSMPVDYLRFALASHYGARMYGVLNGARTGGSDGDPDSFLVNSCLRMSLWEVLTSVCQEVENRLGYNLTERYHRATVEMSPTMRLQTEWTGVEKTDVVRSYSDVVLTATVDPLLEKGLTAVLDGSITYVQVDGTLLGNPQDAILRLHSTGGALDILLGQGYPKKVGSDWRIAINTRATPIPSGDTIDVQHRHYVYADIETEDALIPFYQGTTQKIPLARPVQSIDDSTKRYWLYVYTLVDPDFYEDPHIDLVSGEFYKLQLLVDFRTESEEPQYARITQKSLKPGELDVVEWKAELVPIDPLRGIFDVKVLGRWEIDPDTEEETLNTNRTYVCVNRAVYSTKIAYAYKTNPNHLPDTIQKSIATALTAILHRVAADLPLSDCGCETKRGFIAEQQKTYSLQLVTPTGVQLMKTEYGDLHGHKVYAEKMSQVPALKARFL